MSLSSEKKPIAKCFWAPNPDQIKRTQLSQFIKNVSKKYNLNIKTYEDLYQWSIQETESFWEEVVKINI